MKASQKYTEGERYDGRGRRRGAGPPVNIAGADEEKVLAIRALDPATGERRWQYIMNSGLSLNPFGGWQTNAGASGILTTASDVLFVGGREGNLVALDARSGKELWHRELGASMIMDPISYAVNGKQFFAIDAGLALYVFGLPEGEAK
jgi:alcohol dehydrogenase (cytochrome c)